MLLPVSLTSGCGCLDGFLDSVEEMILRMNVVADGTGEKTVVGDGESGFRIVPVPTRLTPSPKGDCGAGHTVALTKDLKVQAIGANAKGQLGDGTTTYRSDPQEVSGITNARDVGAGYEHSAALTNDGTVYAWGDNAFGQLGNGGATTNETTPIMVPLPGPAAQISVALWDHNFAVLEDGRVFGWGGNGSGQIGLGHTDPVTAPEQVSVPGPITVIAGGANHTLFLVGGGEVYATGANYLGQLGVGNTDNQSTPVIVPGLVEVAHVAAGFEHSLAVLENGTVFAWGNNGSGQLGVGAGVGFSTVPLQVPGLDGVVEVFAGMNHSVAVRHDGTVFAWGDNSNGQLGIGSTAGQFAPQPVTLPNRAHWIATGFDATLFFSPGSPAGLLDIVLEDVPSGPNLSRLPVEVFEVGAPTPFMTGDIRPFAGHAVHVLPPGPEAFDVRLIPGGTHLSRRITVSPSPDDQDVDLGTLTFLNGDVNGNNSINIADFLLLRAAFGTGSGGPGYDDRADLDKSGTVNIADFLILRRNFGQSGE